MEVGGSEMRRFLDFSAVAVAVADSVVIGGAGCCICICG